MDCNMRKLPAYPLFINDPYFSVWSAGDVLNEIDTTFWSGKSKKTYGIVIANGKSYCFLGVAKDMEKLTQTGVEITTFRTKYFFTCDEFDLEVAFFSPTPINDYEIWSCPTCYLEYKLIPKTQLNDVTVSLSLHQEWCYSSGDNTSVRGDVFNVDGMDVGYFGLTRQHVFNRTGDRVGADWGYYYLAADKCYCHTIPDFKNLTEKECYIPADDADNVKYLTAQNVYDNVTVAIEGKIVVAFDDVLSINYYGEMLKGYYFADGKNIMDAIKFSVNEYDKVCKVCDGVEKQLAEDTKKYSDKYRAILNASYRQVLAAHKLVKDSKGRLIFLSKECGSGGCVATVDVTYPSMPMLLLYQPELVRASLDPIFDFAKMDVWEYEFAPHDAGQYPYCNGQFYGVCNKTEGRYGRTTAYQGAWDKETLPSYYLYPKGSNIYDFNRQMPIEECADMILVCAFYLACGGDKEYIKNELSLLKQWCEYLISKGLIPENQLCTDDFLNHMDKNVNLAIKATVAIGAFAKLVESYGEDGSRYEQVAKERVAEFAKRFPNKPMPLSFDDTEDTFSMKYNLMPDKLLGLNLFGEAVTEREVDCSLAHQLKFGHPLDNRGNLTKSDWMMWMAALTDDIAKQEKIIEGIYNYLVECVDRVPFGDLFDCETSVMKMFTNRTVQSSMFVLLLKDKMMRKN